MVLEKDKEKSLLAFDIKKSLLCHFHIENGNVLILIVLILPIVLELGEHETNCTKDVDMVHVESF